MAETVKYLRGRAAVGLGALAASLLLAASVGAQTSPKAPPSVPPVAAIPVAQPARPAVAPSPEALQLATIIADGYIDSALADMPAQFDDMLNLPIFKSSVFNKAPFNDPALTERYPGWIEAVRHATFAAMADCTPRLKALLAHALAERFSIEELRAGAQFMSGPGGQYAARIYMHERPAPDSAAVTAALKPETLNGLDRKAVDETLEAANAKAHRPLPPEAEAALLQLKQTAAGRQFAKDALNAGVLLKPYQADYLQAVMGPILLHLSEDLAADQAHRDATVKDSPPPEALALGASIVHGVYASIDDKDWATLSTLAADAIAKIPASQLKDTDLPPGYTQVALTTMLDTLHYDQPVMEKAVGRALARLCTTEDLRALAEFTNGPAPAYFEKIAMASISKVAGAHGANTVPPQMSPEVRASVEKFSKSGVVQHLAAKLKDKAAREELVATGIDMTVPIMAQWMHRLGEKFESLDAEHRAARGW